MGSKLNWIINEKNDLYLDLDYSAQIYDNSDGGMGTLQTCDTTQCRGGYATDPQVNRFAGILAHTGNYDFGRWKNTLSYSSMRNTARMVTGRITAEDVGKNRGLRSDDVTFDTRLLKPIGSNNILNIGGEFRNSMMRDLAGNKNQFTQNNFAIFEIGRAHV